MCGVFSWFSPLSGATSDFPPPDHAPCVTTLTSEDEGKILVDAEGDELGVVTDVESDTVWIDPDPGLGEAALAAFGWSDHDEDDYTVDADAVDTVTEGELRVDADL